MKKLILLISLLCSGHANASMLKLSWTDDVDPAQGIHMNGQMTIDTQSVFNESIGSYQCSYDAPRFCQPGYFLVWRGTVQTHDVHISVTGAPDLILDSSSINFSLPGAKEQDWGDILLGNGMGFNFRAGAPEIPVTTFLNSSDPIREFLLGNLTRFVWVLNDAPGSYKSGSVNLSVTEVPLPGSLALFATGVLGLVFARRTPILNPRRRNAPSDLRTP